MLQTGRLAADHWDWHMGALFMTDASCAAANTVIPSIVQLLVIGQSNGDTQWQQNQGKPTLGRHIQLFITIMSYSLAAGNWVQD